MGKIKSFFNFDNIGGKIKKLAKVFCWIGIIGSWVASLIWIIAVTSTGTGADYIIFVIIPIVAGPFLSWISSFALYGFGELIEKTCEIARNTSIGGTKSEPQPKVDSERISKIEKLHSQGLITEEEYQQAISKVQ